MSCRAATCGEEQHNMTFEGMCGSCGTGDVKEGFNAGYQPYLGYSGYPGSEFPSQCGGGYGYGGMGHYGTYGGCATQDHYDFEKKLDHTEFAHTEFDAHDRIHEPGCQCMNCQTPYSFPYHANANACQNPYCKCGDCDGNCKCGAAEVAPAAGGLPTLFDIGLTNGTGLKGHLKVPFLNVHVDFNALLKYAVMIMIVAAIAYYLLGLRLRR
jgi:hypothetical protein